MVTLGEETMLSEITLVVSWNTELFRLGQLILGDSLEMPGHSLVTLEERLHSKVNADVSQEKAV